MKVAKQYTIEELNKMSVPAAKKNAIRLGIPRTPHPRQHEIDHPTCSNQGCTNPKAVNNWHWTSGQPEYKDVCVPCHRSLYKFGNQKFRKDYCENIDRRLGFVCTTTIPMLDGKPFVGMLDRDHIDGNPDNEPEDGSNFQTLCKCCHAYKTIKNKDYLTPGRKKIKMMKAAQKWFDELKAKIFFSVAK